MSTMTPGSKPGTVHNTRTGMALLLPACQRWARIGLLACWFCWLCAIAAISIGMVLYDTGAGRRYPRQCVLALVYPGTLRVGRRPCSTLSVCHAVAWGDSLAPVSRSPGAASKGSFAIRWLTLGDRVASGAAPGRRGRDRPGGNAFEWIVAGCLGRSCHVPLVRGLIATLVVYRLASVEGRTMVATMLSAGIAVNALA